MTNGDDGLPIEARRLAAFLGRWRVEGFLTAGEDRVAVSGTWRFTKAVNGWGVSGSLDTEIEGMGAFEESELVGFDTVEGKIHLFSMNKFTIRDHSGGWIDEGKLAVQYDGVHEGTEVTEEITIDFAAPDRIVGTVIERADGEVIVTTDLTMTRQS